MPRSGYLGRDRGEALASILVVNTLATFHCGRAFYNSPLEWTNLIYTLYATYERAGNGGLRILLGPLLDHFDMHVDVDATITSDLDLLASNR